LQDGIDLKLGELEVYQLSIDIGRDAWQIYGTLPKTLQFSMGDQLLRAADSIGANIAEGFGRFHYLDSAKFYYNARGSLWETQHWFFLLQQRKLIPHDDYTAIQTKLDTLGRKLNNFIRITKQQNDR
jgi:four helix bundle protein